MNLVDLLVTWAIVPYLNAATVCGCWRKDQAGYPLRDGAILGALLLLVSLLPLIGVFASGVLIVCCKRRGIDFDWPWRLVGPEALRRCEPPSVAATVTVTVTRGGGGGARITVAKPGVWFRPNPRTPLEAAVRGLQVLTAILNKLPDPAAPETLGYREWLYDAAGGVLRSPTQGTPWSDAELRCESWDESDVVRGVAGIHAHLVPLNWRSANAQTARGRLVIALPPLGVPMSPALVCGIVERFGRFVLGTEGWRAEWVVIRQLHAPSRALAAALKITYPEVEITHEDR